MSDYRTSRDEHGDETAGSLLIVGCGYVGSEVARRILPDGRTVYALTRSEQRSRELSLTGVTPIVADLLGTGGKLPAVENILFATPHRAVESQGSETHVRYLKKLFSMLPSGWKRLIYLSTTGVYGDTEGKVTEATSVAPTREGPEIACRAEEYLQGCQHSERCTILRLAGIYGPNRIPLAAKLKAGEPLRVPQAGFLNLIHVDDIAAILCRMLRTTMAYRTYVLSDGRPVQRVEFYNELAARIGVTDPAFLPPDPNDSRQRRAGNRKVDPTLLFSELGEGLRFPSYREGLENSLKSES